LSLQGAKIDEVVYPKNQFETEITVSDSRTQK